MYYFLKIVPKILFHSKAYAIRKSPEIPRQVKTFHFALELELALGKLQSSAGRSGNLSASGPGERYMALKTDGFW
jgi:hypothetical protein